MSAHLPVSIRKPARKIAYVLTIHCPCAAVMPSSLSIEGSAIVTIEKSTSNMKKVALSSANATQIFAPGFTAATSPWP